MRSCCLSVLKVLMGLTRLNKMMAPRLQEALPEHPFCPCFLEAGSLNSLTAASSPLTLARFITLRRRAGLPFRPTGWHQSTCGGQHSLPFFRSLTSSTFLQVSFAWLLGFLAKIKRQVSACEVTFMDFGDYYLSIFVGHYSPCLRNEVFFLWSQLQEGCCLKNLMLV